MNDKQRVEPCMNGGKKGRNILILYKPTNKLIHIQTNIRLGSEARKSFLLMTLSMRPLITDLQRSSQHLVVLSFVRLLVCGLHVDLAGLLCFASSIAIYEHASVCVCVRLLCTELENRMTCTYSHLLS